MLIFNGIAIAITLVVAFILSSLAEFRFTDIVFIGALIMLAGAAAFFSLARREMRKAVKNKAKDEKKKYRMLFRETEQHAFILFASSSVLFLISFLTAQ